MSSQAIEHVVEIGPLPATIDEYLVMRDRVARTPEGGAAAFAIALVCYARDPAHGLPYVTVAIAMDLLDDDPTGYKGRRPRRAIVQNLTDRLNGPKAHIPRSYVQGTRWEDGYALPAGALTVRVKQQANSVQGERAKVFVFSSGADTPRPVSLARNDKGLWKATEWSSLEVGVRAPGPRPTDDL
ncbi:MAG: hypothetical protein JNL83_37115 [Myxococcales bacterium]|nr:hypothetical protein [Myxococcales bacterium]